MNQAIEHGTRFGNLTVLRRIDSRDRGPRYICGCACGYKKVRASEAQLMKGRIKSCSRCANMGHH